MPITSNTKDIIFWKSAQEWLEKRTEEIDKKYRGRNLSLVLKKLFKKHDYKKELNSRREIKQGLSQADVHSKGIILKHGEDNLSKLNEHLSNQYKRRFIYQLNLIEDFLSEEFSHYCEKKKIRIDPTVREEYFTLFINKDKDEYRLTRMLGLTLQEVYRKLLPVIGAGELDPVKCPVNKVRTENNYGLTAMPRSIDGSNKKSSETELTSSESSNNENENKFRP